MNRVSYINYNGTFFSKNDPVISPDNRSFCYGDGIFETIHSNGSVIQYFDIHYKRIIYSLSTLKYEIPSFFNKEYLFQQITKTLTKNRIFKGGRVRLSIFRKQGGLYTPLNNEPDFLIDTSNLEYDVYTLNQQGWEIDLYSEIKKPINIFSNIKSANALLFVMASLNKKLTKINDVIILNEKNHLVESSNSNLFVYKNNTLFTPPLSDGCIDGVMRRVIINFARDLKINVEYKKSLSSDILINAEEVFLTNAINGIRWVVAYKNHRYYNKLAKNLISELNGVSFLDKKL